MNIIFFGGIVSLLLYLFVPLAYISEKAIVLLPLLTNDSADQDMWQWQNTAAFVMTYFISVVLLVYFKVSEKKPGIKFAIVINFVSVLIIFTIIWMTKAGLNFENTFTYGSGWIFWITGFIMMLITAKNKPVAD